MDESTTPAVKKGDRIEVTYAAKQLGLGRWPIKQSEVTPQAWRQLIKLAAET